MKIYQDIDYKREGNTGTKILSENPVMFSFGDIKAENRHCDYLRTKEKPENQINKICNFKWPNNMKEALFRSRLEARNNRRDADLS